MSKITPQRSSAGSFGPKKPSLSAMLVLVAMLFNVLVPIVSAKSSLMSGESLKNGEYLESPDGTKRFVIEDGKAVIYQTGIRELQTWLLTPENYQGSDRKQFYFALDSYGMLAGHDASGKMTRLIRESLRLRMEGAWKLSLWDNGLLYLITPTGTIAWNNICDTFVESLESSGTLFMSDCIVSSDHRSFLYMKHTGNLVLYNGYTSVYSWSKLYHREDQQPVIIYLYLTSTGTLKIRKHNTNDEWVIFKNDRPGVKEGKYRLTITNNAKLRIADSRDNMVALIG
ncbi:MAG: hypothetical protein J3Q66DRAFT_362950 [Benniella sp.]|nr:MAG: hypothetical protein J3Q66DRAFT_362950 [Benniella sp.]